MKPTVVIVGAGFGGLEAARSLKGADARIVVLDRHNHHLFQPLLYQVATAGLSPADISVPIRSVLRKNANAEVRLTEVLGVDPKTKEVTTDHGKIPYDYLVLATGSRFHYFGNEAWRALAPGLKSIPDAIDIRRRILLAFEAAEIETVTETRKAFLTFVVVGGGPTGVEMAGAIAELAHKALKEDFRRIEPHSARVILVESGPRILGTFPEALAAKARTKLKDLGVEVREKTTVKDITSLGTDLGGDWLSARTVIWAAGVAATPIAKWLGIEGDRAGRIAVGPDLKVPAMENVYIIGDAALVLDAEGKPLPGVAPVAKQEGKYVARHIGAALQGKPLLKPFRYVDKGNLATIGRSSAVADVRGAHLSGLLAWLIWVVVHVYYLIGFQNRALVLFHWAWNYLTFQKGARLITPRD